MINSKEIYEKANEIVAMSNTRNPLSIAKMLDIEVLYNNEFSTLLGMYACVLDKRVIFINERLDADFARLIIAHEIGHDIMHRELAQSMAFKENAFFNMKDTTEYEANAFASHLLIDTDELLSHIHDSRDLYEIATLLNVNVNFVLIKIKELQKLGYTLTLPETVHGDFLKLIKI